MKVVENTLSRLSRIEDSKKLLSVASAMSIIVGLIVFTQDRFLGFGLLSLAVISTIIIVIDGITALKRPNASVLITPTDRRTMMIGGLLLAALIPIIFPQLIALAAITLILAAGYEVYSKEQIGAGEMEGVIWMLILAVILLMGYMFTSLIYIPVIGIAAWFVWSLNPNGLQERVNGAWS